MIPMENAEKPPVFWIPSFKSQSKILIDKPSVLSDLIVSHNERKFRIASISEDSNFQLLFDSEYKNTVLMEENSDDIFLDSKFYMAVVHYNIVNKLNIPSIFTLICSQEDWIKPEN